MNRLHWTEVPFLVEAPGKLAVVVDAVNDAQAMQRGAIALGVRADLVRAHVLHGEPRDAFAESLGVVA